MRPLAVLAVAAVSAPASVAAGSWTAAAKEGVVIDWTAGAARAPGVGPADRHAPSPAVARVAARRAAVAQARRRVAAAARALPVAGGGTVGDALDASADAAARFAAEVERAPVVADELATDGSSRVTVALGLEAVRQAIAGPRTVTGDDGGAAVWIVEAPASTRPAIGLALAVDGTRWDGAVVWTHDRAAVAATPTGKARATAAATGGVLAVSGPSAPPPAGALVVVVVPEKKP